MHIYQIYDGCKCTKVYACMRTLHGYNVCKIKQAVLYIHTSMNAIQNIMNNFYMYLYIYKQNLNTLLCINESI